MSQGRGGITAQSDVWGKYTKPKLGLFVQDRGKQNLESFSFTCPQKNLIILITTFGVFVSPVAVCRPLLILK